MNFVCYYRELKGLILKLIVFIVSIPDKNDHPEMIENYVIAIMHNDTPFVFVTIFLDRDSARIKSSGYSSIINITGVF